MLTFLIMIRYLTSILSQLLTSKKEAQKCYARKQRTGESHNNKNKLLGSATLAPICSPKEELQAREVL